MTIREHLKRCRARHDSWEEAVPRDGAPYKFCIVCDEHWPCPDYRDAVAALTILDAAELDMFDHETGIVRIVPDYQAGRDLPHHAPGWRDLEPEDKK